MLDAQGVPAIEAEIHTNRGVFSAIAPTGHSSSMYASVLKTPHVLTVLVSKSSAHWQSNQHLPPLFSVPQQQLDTVLI